MPTRFKTKTWIEISASALKHNIAAVFQHIQPTRVMAVVKANAYGHGLWGCSNILRRTKEIAWFGVDSLEEAMTLRKQGISKPILILGYIPEAAIPYAVCEGFSFVAYRASIIDRAAKAGTRMRPARIHLKIETGLQRQGVLLKNLHDMARQIKKCSHLIVEGVSTHYANIEDTDDPAFAMRQLNQFHRAIDVLEQEGIEPEWKHTACSAATLLYPQTHFNLVRLGIAMYGIWPSEQTRITAEKIIPHLTLKPVLAWKTVIAQIKRVPAGAPIGYGLTARAKKSMQLAILPVGYYDGFDRVGMSNGGLVLINGVLCPVVGRVCMNMCMVDVTQAREAKEEDAVILIGAQKDQRIDAEAMAARAQTINYEILARLGAHIERRIIL